MSSVPSSDGIVLKRKAEEFGPESKRLKGIGIGAPEGPVSLDDFRSLQHSNTELRKQLENHVLTIDALRNESQDAVETHDRRKVANRNCSSLTTEFANLKLKCQMKKKSSDFSKKRMEELEIETRRMKRDLDKEKVVRIDELTLLVQ